MLSAELSKSILCAKTGMRQSLLPLHARFAIENNSLLLAIYYEHLFSAVRLSQLHYITELYLYPYISFFLFMVNNLSDGLPQLSKTKKLSKRLLTALIK